MNLEVPHQVVFLEESWMHTSGSESKILVMALASPLRRGDQQYVPGTLSCLLEHEMDFFLVQVSFVSGEKSGGCHGLMNG